MTYRIKTQIILNGAKIQIVIINYLYSANQRVVLIGGFITYTVLFFIGYVLMLLNLTLS